MQRRIPIASTTLSLILSLALWGTLTVAAQTPNITFTRIVDSFHDPADPDFLYDQFANSFTLAYAPSLDGDDLAFFVSAGGPNQRVLTTVIGGIRQTVANDAFQSWRFIRIIGASLDGEAPSISFKDGLVAFLMPDLGVFVGDASQPPGARLTLVAARGVGYTTYETFQVSSQGWQRVAMDQGKVVFWAGAIPVSAGAGIFRAFPLPFDTYPPPVTEFLADTEDVYFSADGGSLAYNSGANIRDLSGVSTPTGLSVFARVSLDRGSAPSRTGESHRGDWL